MKLLDIDKNPNASSDGLSFEHFLLRGLSNALLQLLGSEDTNLALHGAFKVLEEVTEFDGIYLIGFNKDKDEKLGLKLVYILDDFMKSKPEIVPGRYFEVNPENPIHKKNLELLEKGQSIHADAKDYEDEIFKALAAAKIHSFSFLPVKVDDQLWGGLVFVNRGKREEWKKEEAKFLELFAQALGNFLARKGAEKALKESEQRLDMVIEGSKLGSWVWDITSNHIQFNDYWAQMLGYDPFELKPSLETFISLVHPDDFDRLWQNINAHMAGENELFEVELRMKTKDGKWRWILDRGRFVEWSKTGLPLRAYGTHMDITDRKRKLEALLEREALMGSLFENSSLGIAIRNNTGKVIRVNKRHCEMLGYTEAEVLALPYEDYVHPKAIDQGRKLILAAIEKQEKVVVMEAEYIKKDGSSIWVNLSISLNYDQDGSMANLIVMAEDITEQHLAIKALQKSEALQKATLNALPDLKMRIKVDGEILEYYPSKEEKEFRLSSTSGVGKNLTNVYPEFIAKGILHNARQAIETKEVRNFEYVIPIKNALVYYEARISAINDQEVIAIIRNISERRKMQQSLQEKIRELDINNQELQKYIDSNMELENFAYIASHDLREPVRTMRTFAQLLKKRHAHKLDESAKNYIDFIVDGSSNMNQLIEDLLTYSRVNTEKHVIETINPRLLIKEVLDGLGEFIQESGVHIQVNALPDSLMANPTTLKQLFQNLISNAIKFRNTEIDPVVKIYAQDINFYWQFTVEDNGIGINPEFHDRIFFLFKKLHNKREYQGTGLGLAICKKIVEQHQGKIWVESSPGAGATFSFTIKK